MDIGIYTIAFNGYGRFAEAWCQSISKLDTKPKQVVIALFGEDHGLTIESKLKCEKLLNGIDYKIVHKGEHVNIGVDRNKAIEELSTEWIMLLSIDDIILNDAIAELEKHDKKYVDIIGCAYEWLLKYQKPQIVLPPQNLNKSIIFDWRNEDSWIPPYSPIRRSFWEEHPYINHEYPNIPMMFELARKNAGFARTDFVCVRYIERLDSHCKGRSTEKQKSIAMFLDVCAEGYSTSQEWTP